MKAPATVQAPAEIWPQGGPSTAPHSLGKHRFRNQIECAGTDAIWMSTVQTNMPATARSKQRPAFRRSDEISARKRAQSLLFSEPGSADSALAARSWGFLAPIAAEAAGTIGHIGTLAAQTSDRDVPAPVNFTAAA
jgi:hypothetical protein